MTTKEARAWVKFNAAALLRIARDEDHDWLSMGADGKPLDEFARRRVARAADLFIKAGEARSENEKGRCSLCSAKSGHMSYCSLYRSR